MVFTDIDHTLISGREHGGVPNLISKLELFGINIIFVTAKSIYEIIHLINKRIPLRRDALIAIAESGAAVYASPGILPWSDDKITFEDTTLEYVKLYNGTPLPQRREEIDELVKELSHIAGCAEELVNIAELAPEFLASITDLPLDEARLIPMRDHMVIYYGGSRECRAKLASMLARMGFYAGIGRNFLHVGLHKGKGFAVSWASNNIPLLQGRPRIGLGDTEPDRDFLEEVEYPVVIPNPTTGALKLGRADYIVSVYPAPRGWVWVFERIFLYKIPGKICL